MDQPKITRRAALIGAATLSLPVRSSAQAPPPVARLTPVQMREDLTFLRTQWAPRDKSFSPQQRAAFDRLMDEALAKVDTRSMHDFVLDIMQAVAIPRNGHTMPKGVGRMLGSLPIRTWSFSDGLHIVSTKAGFDGLLGARIDRLGSLATDEALIRAAPYVSGTDQRRKAIAPDYLATLGMLQRIGAAGDAEQVALTLRYRDGHAGATELGPVQAPAGMHARYTLIPDDPDTPDRLPHVLDGIKERPLTYGREVDISRAWIGARNDVLYIRSNSSETLEQKALFGLIQNSVVPRKPRYVVVDIRLNFGGNFLGMALFAESLPRLIPDDGRIFVLVGRSTFSAAIVLAAMLRSHGGRKVAFIGEAMGDDPGFWAETGTMLLPNSGIPVDYATQFEDWGAGCNSVAECYWPAYTLGVKDISLAPDIVVTPSFAEYAAGRDPVLEATLALAT